MDEFGMQLKLTTGEANWDWALAYAEAMREADGDEDKQIELLDEYLSSGGPDDVLGELMCDQISLRDVASMRELYADALSGATEYAAAMRLPDGIVTFACMPETGADALVERMWRQGVLSAAGFEL